MKKLMHERGQGLVEYALVLVLVAVVVVGVLAVLGPQIGNVFSRINNSLDGVISNEGGNDNNPNQAMVLNASTITDGSGMVSVDVTLSEDANVTLRDQDSSISTSNMCNTPCRLEINGLAASGTIEVIAPGNSITVNYSN